MSSRCSCWFLGSLAGLIALTALLAGCSTKRYRKAADNETYKIIQQVEQAVFGHTNAFTIDTKYSGRKPKEIPPAEIIDDRNASNRMVINLEQALELAVKNSREYQTQKEQLYLAALALTGERYEFTPQFFGSSEVTGLSGTSDLGPQGVGLRSSFGVSQLLKTGGRLSVTLANDLFHYFTFGNSRGDTTVNVLTVNLTQPLLRGFGVNDPQLERLTQAERDVVYAIRSYSLYQQEFAINVVNTYFDLLTQKEVVRNNYHNYTNYVELTAYLRARAVDRVRQSEVDDAQNSELRGRLSYINTLASYLNQLDAFKLLLGLPLSTSLYLDDADLKELMDAGISQVDIDREAAFRTCVDKHMSVLNAIDQFEDSKRKVRIAADQLKADVTLYAEGNIGSARSPQPTYISRGGRTITNWTSGALSTPLDYGNFDLQSFSYSAGLQLNRLPFDRLPERNAYRRSLVQFERDVRSLALTLDEFKDRIDRGLRSVEQARLNYVNGVETLRVAERRLDNNLMLLEAGRADVRSVREAQDSLINAQNNLAQIYPAYLRARLELLLNIGVIETKPGGFWLRDPLKETMTAEQRAAPELRMPDDRVLPPELFLDPKL